jgi:protein-serine/threonine kinase
MQNYGGSCAYPDDAEQIKAHPFFHGTPWDRLHRMEPPFVPWVPDSRSLTKYFEHEDDIMGSYDDDSMPAPVLDVDGGAKEVTRARDKILRDPTVGRQVLEVRKTSAFLGYTYRRPRLVQEDDVLGLASTHRRRLVPTIVAL